MEPLIKLDFESPFPRHSGKVREIFDLGDKLIIVTTDRISAYDWVLPNGIPYKGHVLNQLTSWWFRNMDVDNHFLTDSVAHMPEPFKSHPAIFGGRTMAVRKFKPLPIEAIVRGYLCGSGYNDYKKEGKVCGISLPPGLQENHPLPRPLFTPSTKAAIGLHDENISPGKMTELVGNDLILAGRIYNESVKLFRKASDILFQRGIIIADTKMEWATTADGVPVLIDEFGTPDSSRFWAVKDFCLGKAPKSMDKQFVRDYLTSVGFDKKSSPPALPEDVVQATSEKYLELFKMITGNQVEVCTG